MQRPEGCSVILEQLLWFVCLNANLSPDSTFLQFFEHLSALCFGFPSYLQLVSANWAVLPSRLYTALMLNANMTERTAAS